MTEPQISPLARRLAEENSIDWRVIPGTGPENRVIERDILTYLARIMSGEIDPPALPDASEPPSPGGAAPDLSEVSNLAAASAGMAKEGIDLSSLLGGTAPAAAGLAAPIFGMPATPEPAVLQPLNPEPIRTAPLDFQASDAPRPPPLDFTFSDEPIAPLAATQNTSLEQISFGDPLPAAPAAVEAPISFAYPATSDPVFSAPPAKLSPSDSIDAEFEIDLDDFDDAPAALEVSLPEVVAPEVSVSEISIPQGNDADFPALELTPPDLAFNAPPAELSPHQEDLVLDIDSTSEAPLTIAAINASNEIDDDLVMVDLNDDFTTSAVSTAPEAFNPEPAAFDSVSFGSAEIEPTQIEPVQLEPVQLKSVQLKSVQLEPAPTGPALIAAIEHDDFEFDLIDTDSLPTESPTPEFSTTEPLQALNPSALLEPDLIVGGVTAAAITGMLGSKTHLEPMEAADSPEPAAPQAAPEPTPPEAISHSIQPSAATPSSSVASGFFQGFAVRRHFDASALTKIQRELTHSLNGRDVPLAVFLARAAQRNLHALGTGDVVTLTRLGDTLEPLSASGLHHSFIEAVQSVARAIPGTMQGLLVLDASSLGVDDLVLPASQPVLTLNVNGDYGHLALAGDVPMSKAADFLAHVAQALEIPVSLVI